MTHIRRSYPVWDNDDDSGFEKQVKTAYECMLCEVGSNMSTAMLARLRAIKSAYIAE